MGKVLFFAPHSGIWVHAFPEALIAETLGKQGDDVVYVTCGEVFREQCVVMDASRVGWQSDKQVREEICQRCRASSDLLRREFHFPGYDLATVLTNEDYAEAERILETVSPEGCHELRVDGVPVGRFAAYELLLRHKKLQLKFTDLEWEEYKISLRYALLSLFGGRRILAAERPDQIIVYNSLYSVNRTICMLAEGRGIPHYFLHAGGNLAHRLQTLMFGREWTFQYVRRLVDQWPLFRDRACPADLMREITDHLAVLLGAESAFTFSTKTDGGSRDLPAFFGIQPGQRVLVATMSSYDERFAAEVVGALPNDLKLLFPRQVDWIQALVEWISTRSDLFLIIRVHPREFPDARRGGGKSEHARLLEQVFHHLPGNARVNWPTDQISIYDLADVADVFLNAWSTAGKEMSLLGVPVVIYSSDLAAYPPEINYLGVTRTDYFAQIDQALKDGWSLERSRLTYRWLAVEYGYGLFDIRDAYTYREHGRPSLGQRIVNRVKRNINPLWLQQQDCRSRPATLFASPEISALVHGGHATPLSLGSRVRAPASRSELEVEEQSLKVELGRIAQLLYGKSGPPPGGKLAAHLWPLTQDTRIGAVRGV